ncbi:penicillin-binding protein [Sphingopyxis sp. QXT-31]|uniref:transglycosylase domain-containing protein n=1 Tax=Sphingopyxis sp. QXT-31 TaxID=1357916 RepID=UPI0009794FED|nr:PBP1A family penicillin-binding protein [Sphingopyxis sp. QXT-31]APZ99911.1 penicillin-binding protein [Sphingopyxis sp. QXT-31]
MRRERQQVSAGKSSASPRSGGSAPKGEPTRWRLWLRRIVRWGLGLALVGLVALAVAVGIAVQRIPSFEELKKSPAGQTIRVHAADGTVFLSLGPNYGRWLTLRETPQVMQDAMVAVEDRRFRYHPGVDPVGMTRAAVVAVQNRGSGRRLQGASTITQQLARNIFLSNSYTWTRKAREMVLSMALEWKFSKDEILELYLNKVYFGGGSYGIDAASRRFFGHSATEMSLSEAAVVAGLVKAPSRYSPTADAQAALGRAGVVLGVMVDAGVITQSQADSAKPADVQMAQETGQNSARYFSDWALPQLDMLIDEGSEAIDVYTTIDLGMQRAATSAIQANVPGGAQGALVSIDRDGAVRAMVGGTDYVASNYNRATQATRQPGSAWKVFVYMAALESGYKVDDEVVDEPVTIRGWSPRNSSGRFAGAMDLRTAFAYSVNTVAAKLGDEVGTSSVANMARRFGISTPINTQPAMVLGSSEVRVIDMTAAFAAISRKGVSAAPYGITKVTTADGRLLYQRAPERGTVLVDDWVAAGITDLMQTAVATGTGRAAQIGRPVAGKTGTTTSNKDGWFLGFSSGLTTGVWMGRDDAKAVGGLQGGRAPAAAFADFMRVAVARRPVEQFDTEVKLPDWQLEDEDEAYLGEPGEGGFVDENGMPVELPYGGSENRPPEEGDEPQVEPPVMDQRWLDEQTGGGNGAQPKAPQPAPKAPPANKALPPAVKSSTVRVQSGNNQGN